MLIDSSARHISYIRISVSDRCDLRCSYCLPKGFKAFSEPAHWLSFDQIVRVAATFARLGVRRIRLTGGEPLVRRDLSSLAARLAQLNGIEDLSLSSNATQLARHAQALFQAGVRRLNISLDSLTRQTIAKICGIDCLDKILDGLQVAQQVGFRAIKINMVPILGVNEHEVLAMAEFCQRHGFILRLIEAMPMGSTGQAVHGAPLAPILAQLCAAFDLGHDERTLGGGPARYWTSRDQSFTLGLITPLSQHFCAQCNRVRLAVDGTLYPCLGQEQRLELAPLLHAKASDAELESALYHAIALKPPRHEFVDKPKQIVRFMSVTGG